jgi:hypothetical protein
MKTENAYSSKELSPTTWPDFEALFAKHNGVWGGCWCMFYHTKGEFLIKGHGPDNKKTKKALVKKRRTHGIIVYSGETPIGWVQYGPKPELPRLDASKTYQKLSLDDEGKKFWRITVSSSTGTIDDEASQDSASMRPSHSLGRRAEALSRRIRQPNLARERA